MSLSTNFKDDILNTSVNQKRKYQMIYNTDGTVSFEDVTKYSQTGSVFGAKEVNEERSAINEINNKRIVSLAEVDLVTEPGFFVDAKAVKELNSKLTAGKYVETVINDWNVKYKLLGNHLAYINIYKNIGNQVSQNRASIGVTLPFKLAFDHMDLAGSVSVAGMNVEKGTTFSLRANGSVEMGCAGYSGMATYEFSAIVVLAD